MIISDQEYWIRIGFTIQFNLSRYITYCHNEFELENLGTKYSRFVEGYHIVYATLMCSLCNITESKKKAQW